MFEHAVKGHQWLIIKKKLVCNLQHVCLIPFELHKKLATCISHYYTCSLSSHVPSFLLRLVQQSTSKASGTQWYWAQGGSSYGSLESSSFLRMTSCIPVTAVTTVCLYPASLYYLKELSVKVLFKTWVACSWNRRILIIMNTDSNYYECSTSSFNNFVCLSLSAHVACNSI